MIEEPKYLETLSIEAYRDQRGKAGHWVIGEIHVTEE